jgi:hypothetical protein
MSAIEHTPQMEELLPVYALAALDGDDLRLLEEHLATGCPVCRRELQLWHADVEALAAGLPEVPPSEMARARAVRAVGAEPTALSRAGAAGTAPPALPASVPTSNRRERMAWLALAAALLLVAWAGWGWRTAERETARLAAERIRLARVSATLEQRLAAARAEQARTERALQIMTAPGMRPILLAGLAAAPGAEGHTFVDPAARRAVFVAANLPRPAPGTTYQLWFIGAEGPVSAGVFDVDAQGRATVEVAETAPVDQIQAWAVTIEPAGGVPQPTGPMVLKG